MTPRRTQKHPPPRRPIASRAPAGGLLWLALLTFGLTSSCSSRPKELPTTETVAELDQVDRASTPPLYQLLYDSAFLPDVQLAEQRTRILIWLRYVDFQEHQLRMLSSLHARAETLRGRLEKSQQDITARYEPELIPAYNAVYDYLRQGADLNDPRFETTARELLELRRHRSREEELIAVRLQSIRALLDEEQDFLRLLTPKQEALFPDVLFVLRRNLDPASNPGDFRLMVGSLFSPGDPTLLLRGDYKAEREPLNIGGLWSDKAAKEITAPVLHESRRELLLYLLLQEPSLPESIDAALTAIKMRAGSAAPEPPRLPARPAPPAPAAPGSTEPPKP